MTARIGTVHALTDSIAPVDAAFASVWADAEVLALCDESLYADYARWGAETPEITRRVTVLLDYSARTGVDGILFAGSLFSRIRKSGESCHDYSRANRVRGNDRGRHLQPAHAWDF